MKRWMAWLLGCLLLLTACEAPSPQENIPPPPSSPETAFVKAVWIPYMEVEEWLSSADPRAAIAAGMEDCQRRGVNTVYFHVRANSDAYYASTVYPLHPSAARLMENGCDPLQVAIEEAHARGMTLHAWVNPYRIGADASRAVTTDVFEADGKWYYIPSAASTHETVTAGVRELVENYDIDGVQFDDYFYPEGAVPDAAPAAFEEADYTAYRQSGGHLSVADRRRAAVNRLVAAVYDICHGREGCVFGISPAYDLEKNFSEKYADVKTWASVSGYVDYLCPQLYFGFSHQYAPFLAEFERWDALPRAESVAMYVGLAAYKTGLTSDTYAGAGAAEWSERDDILARQLQVAKEAAWDGAALYSHRSIAAEDGRDASIVQAEWEALCAAWNQF